jgi:HEAT repeat protein
VTKKVTGNAKSLAELINDLESERSAARSEAAFILGLVTDKRAVEPLIKVLQDRSDEVRYEAVNALGALGDLRAFDPLLQMAQDQNIEVSSDALVALAELGDKRAVAPLLEILENKQNKANLRRAAILGLGILGDATALPALKAVQATDTSKDENGLWLKDEAANAIKEIEQRRKI